MSKRLIDAIYEEDANKVARLLEKGCDPNGAYLHLAPLVEACDKSVVEVVDVLLRFGAHVNQPDLKGNSPLMVACFAGNLNTVKLLLEHGADVHYHKGRYACPLSSAVSTKRKKHLAVVELLLQHGADPNGVLYSDTGVAVGSILLTASKLGSSAIVRFLIQAGARVNDAFFFGTPIIGAVKEGRVDNVAVLLAFGADPTIAAPDDPKLLEIAGKNALELAQDLKKRNVLEVFRRHGYLSS